MKKFLAIVMTIGLLSWFMLQGAHVFIHSDCLQASYQQFLDLKAAELLLAGHPAATLLEHELLPEHRIVLHYQQPGGAPKKLVMRIEPDWRYQKIARIHMLDEGLLKPFLVSDAVKGLIQKLNLAPKEHQRLLKHSTQEILGYYLSQQWQEYQAIYPCELELSLPTVF